MNDHVDTLYPLTPALLDRPIAIVGSTGSGKTYAAKGAVELLLHAGRRVCIVDPTGVWWGLRRTCDGKPGFPVAIFGGEHADVPIGPDAGDCLGRLVAASDVRAAIVDTSELSTGESIRLLTPFFESLYAGLRGPLHLVVDEADAMAPQNPLPEGRRLLGVVDKIARRGRVKGFRPLWITQRPAVLNKNVLSQVATLVAMKLRGPQDRKALDAWIQGNADAGAAKGVVQQLAGLPTGTGFVWCPDEDLLECRVFPPIGTADTSRAPEDGEEQAAPATLADIDVDALRAALGAAQTAAGPGSSATPGDLTAAERRGFARGHAAGLADGRRAAETEAAALRRSIADLLRGAARDVEREAAADPAAAPETKPPAAAVPASLDTRLPRSKRSLASGRHSDPSETPTRTDAGGLGVAAQAIVSALDTCPFLWRTWQEVAILAGVRSRGGHFNALRKTLTASGLIKTDRGSVAIAVFRPDAPPPAYDRAALVELWAGKLKGAAPNILRHLFASGPCPRVEVASVLGLQPSGGHWNAAWKQLRDDGLVTVADDGTARLTHILAAEARP